MGKIVLPESDEKLLEECDVETFRSSGKGGQHVNKTETAVRITHRSTAIVVASQQERSQYRNKQICLKKLRSKVERLNYRPPKRIKTSVPKRAIAEVREAKTIQSQKKRMRAKSKTHDDEA